MFWKIEDPRDFAFRGVIISAAAIMVGLFLPRLLILGANHRLVVFIACVAMALALAAVMQFKKFNREFKRTSRPPNTELAR